MDKVTLILISLVACALGQGLSFNCLVENCQICTAFNFCGLCQPNFILSLNETTGMTYCSPFQCTIQNCQECLGDNLCYQCDQDFYKTPDGTCVSEYPDEYCFGQNCATCINNTGTCTSCFFGSYLMNGSCYLNVTSPTGMVSQSCNIFFNPGMCRLCFQDSAVGPSFQCMNQYNHFSCNVTNCISCLSQDNCSVCAQGFSASSNADGSCVPALCSVDNCMMCQNQTNCAKCLPGFSIQNNTCNPIVPACVIENCTLCGASPIICLLCNEGYIQSNVFEGYGANAVFCSPGTPSPIIQNCKEGFLLIGEDCVANLTVPEIECDIENCLWCSFTNYCGGCANGFHPQLFSGICLKNFSPLPGCEFIELSVNSYDYSVLSCGQCSEGFTMVMDIQQGNQKICVKMPDFACTVPGCLFCSSQDFCNSCNDAYTSSPQPDGSVECIPIYNVPNCSLYDRYGECLECDFPLMPQGPECAPMNCENLAICKNCTCTECNNLIGCTLCNEGVLIRGECYDYGVPIQNMLGCKVYKPDQFMPICQECQIGFILAEQGFCFMYPCEIENCNFCFRSLVCIVCSEGYNLVDSVCLQMEGVEDCPTTCSACQINGTCTSCITGYTLHQGECVCPFQNCLQCQANALCTKCASFPVFIPQVIQGGGCVPLPSVPILCQIPDCSQCYGQNKCSYCFLGFSLANNTCVMNPCQEESNCLLCNTQGTICYTCDEGYMPDELLGDTCVPIPHNYSCLVQGCSVCSSNSNKTCEKCLQFHALSSDNQTCNRFQCSDNCIYCIAEDTCMICMLYYYLNTSSQCEIVFTYTGYDYPVNNCSIPFCVDCVLNQQGPENYTSICLFCQFGYEPSPDQLTCLPQICQAQNCVVCAGVQGGSSQCIICEQGYFLNTHLECVAYTLPSTVTVPSCSGIYNCFYCAYPNSCSQCADGWLGITNVQAQYQYQIMMNKSTTFMLNTTICVTEANCSDENCLSCTFPDHCLLCGNGTVLMLNDGMMCGTGCGIGNCIMCADNVSCLVCESPFQVSLDNSECGCPPGNESCPCSLEYCSLCSSSNQSYCLQCSPTFIYNTTTQTCQCPPTFILQTGTAQCVCPQYSSSYQGQCISCKVSNCSVCEQPNICSQCNNGSTLSNNLCPLCQIDGCTTCSMNNYCVECSEGLSLTSNADQCVVCNLPDCALCSAENICDVCDNGYQLSYNSSTLLSNGVCVLCSVANCASCLTDNVCSNCYTGFTLLNNVCVPCVYPCETCNSTGECLTCQQPYSLTANSGKCFTCNAAFCAQCEQTNPSVCLGCIQGYTLNSTSSQCQPQCSPILRCLDCTVAQNVVTCSKCAPGYALIGNKCTQCSQSSTCLECDPQNISACLKCVPGWSNQLLPSSQVCAQCDSNNCETCLFNAEGVQVCDTFKKETRQFQTTVKVQTFPLSYQMVPATCNPGCARCQTDQPTNCYECMPSYGLVYDTDSTILGCCMPCPQHCLKCQNTNTTSECLQCSANAQLSDGKCVVNSVLNCLLVNSSNVCTVCNDGYILKTSNSVVNCQLGCPQNCLSCSSGTCSKCASGFTLNAQSMCVPCLSNCRMCSAEAPGTCLGCGFGFYLTSNMQCQTCSVASCYSCYQNMCMQCLPGYQLTNSLQCAKLCEYPCATCGSNLPSECTSCLAGYSYNSSSNSCNANNQVSQTAASDCSSCSPGQYPNITNSSQCLNCPLSCLTCSSASNCLSCRVGYTMVTQSVANSPQVCIQCSFPCAQCYGSPNVCTACYTGFKMNGWKCMSTFNFQVSMTLGVNISVFYQNYQSFLTQFAGIVSPTSNLNSVSVVSVQEGSSSVENLAVKSTSSSSPSTLVNLQLITTATANSAQASSQLASISNLAAQGNSIAGMNIENSQITTNGGQADETSNGLSTGAIIAIAVCVPVGSLILIGLIVYCCIRKRRSKQMDAMRSVYENSSTDRKEVRQTFELSHVRNESMI